MQKIKIEFAALAICALVGGTAGAQSLEEGFVRPPDSAKPHTWFHMMNGNVTKEGLTRDFEELAKVGIGGVQMFDAGCAIPPGPLAFNSPAWFDMFLHAAKEARRLGLEICIPNCSGWSSSGGPWNMPSNGMKVVTWRDVRVKGPSKFCAKLPRETKDNGFYEDIAVLAFPTPPAEHAAFPDVRTDLSEKGFVCSSARPFTVSGVSFELAHDWIWSGDADILVETSEDGRTFTRHSRSRFPLARSGSAEKGLRFHPFAAPVTVRSLRVSFPWTTTSCKVTAARPEAKMSLSGLKAKTFEIRQEVRRDTVPTAADQVVAKESVIDLTARLAADGTLAWDVPAGDWTILRIGHLCNGRRNHPASDHGVGLEVDKLSASAMDYHFDQYVTRLCRHLGPLAGDVSSGFNNILVDSYEVGSQNWTQGLDRIFEARVGYSLRPYLPVFSGRVVGSVDESERFLEDFRRVVSDLFAENYAGRLAELCHRHGLKLSLEPYGNCPADNLQYGQDVDIPMGEFWSAACHGDHGVGTGNARFASYLAHVWGRRYAATESFTASPNVGGRWTTTPFSIKAQGDAVYCEGVNRIIYHRFTHQPWADDRYLPGMTMGRWGMHLDRTQTWWRHAAPWFRYQARCQWMLQEGRFVADALFFCGEQAPNQGGNTDGSSASDMKLPPGYNWDICATKALESLKVVDGSVVVPGGVSYRLLVLPPSETMSEKTLMCVSSLLDAGAKVCCLKKPSRSPGLRGYPTADARVAALADRVWAKGILPCSPAEALARLGIRPDFDSRQASPAPTWIHRRGATGDDWYFVALNNVTSTVFEVSFRQTGRVPEIWDAVSGSIAPATEWHEADGRTFVTLSFSPSGSSFVMFRKPAAGRHAVRTDVSVSRRADPVPDATMPHSLVIRQVLYGVFADRRRPDCADVSKFVEEGKPVVVSNGTLGGDPAPNRYKKMEVRHVLDGKTCCDVVKEHATYTLPKGARLLSAWYGLIDPGWKPKEDAFVDITDRVRTRVKDARISVAIDNVLAGVDPKPMTPKKARISYSYDGEEKSVLLNEHQTLNVPSTVAAADAVPAWCWGSEGLMAIQPLTARVTYSDGSEVRFAANPPPSVVVDGAWQVAFPAGWDAPASVTFPRLMSWTQSADNGIRYFSGTASYTKRVEGVRPGPRGERTLLDLGVVRNFAVVTANGRAYPVLWKPPYCVDVTDALRDDGVLELSVEVTNLWPNRLIGDDRLYAADCEWRGVVRHGVKEIGVKELPLWVREGKPSPTGRHTFTTWQHWSKTDDLLPSGLLGPVYLRRQVSANPL